MNPWVAPSVAGVAAFAVALWAWRGRRVDDHPLCRRCGFDLFGKPDDSTVCSECGADLLRRRAVRVGTRVTRPRVLRPALAVLFVSAGWLGVLVNGRAGGVNWDHHKPAAWLVRDAERGDAAARDAALAELARRVQGGVLARDREEVIVAKALAYHADSQAPWVPAWGGVVTAARAAGRLPDGQWRRYLTQAARGGDPASRDAALAALAGGVGDATVPQAEVDALLDEVLARQVDGRRPWVTGWGDLLEAAARTGRLSWDRRVRYELNGYLFSMAPTRAAFGWSDDLEFRIRRLPGRWGPSGQPPWRTPVGVYARQEVRIGGEWRDARVAHPWGSQSGAYKADRWDMPEHPDAGEPICFADNNDVKWLVDVWGVDERPVYGRRVPTTGKPQPVRVRLVLRPIDPGQGPADPLLPSRIVDLDAIVIRPPPPADR